MGKHNARPRPGRMIPVLGTSCGLLAAAAFTGGLRPAIALPEAGDPTIAVARGAAESASDTATPLGGPLQMPEIGVVAPGFDEKYAALLSAVSSTPAPLPPALTPARPTPTTPPAAPQPNTSDDVSPTPTPPAPVTPPAEKPPAEKPPAQKPPAEKPPAEKPPAEEPPGEEPPGEEPPAEEPPEEEPPPEEPAEEPLEDVELAVGEAFDVLDATGQVAYTIVVDGIVPDVVCTAEGNLPAENGHLLGLQLRVTTGPAPAEGTPSPVIGTSDFGAAGADGVPVAEADTPSAAACLDETEDFPSAPLAPEQETAGTIVLDVADVTGTVTFRPAAPTISLLWRF